MPTADGSIPTASNIVIGKILHKESGNGIANLLVVLFDLDAWLDPESGGSPVPASGATNFAAPVDLPVLYKMGDRIGSVITDASGNFRFDIFPGDFNLPRKTEQ